MGAPWQLECIPCSDKEGLQQFRGGGSRHGQITPTGYVAQPHPDNYKVPQFLEALQNGQNITALGALGIPHLDIFSGADPPLPKEEATYNKWSFEVHSL